MTKTGATGSNEALSSTLFYAAVAFVIAWTLFGGDAPDRLPIFFILALTGSWLSCCSVVVGGASVLKRASPVAWVLLAAVVLAPLLQLVPLPPAIWRALPGRQLTAAILDATGSGQRWRPITLSIDDTLQTSLVTLWLAGFAVAVLQLPSRRLSQLFGVYFLLGLLHVAIGLVQMASRGTLLSLYPTLHRGFLIGLFANKNHAGLFIAATFLTGFAARQGDGWMKRLGPALAAPLALVMLAAIVATFSRAALLLGLIALGVVLLLMFEDRLTRRVRVLAAGLLVVLALLAVAGSSDLVARSLGRFDAVGTDPRWVYWQRSWPLVVANFPIGAGYGSFPALFMTIERLDWVKPTYLNHAHNDYLEQLIEVGIAAPLLWGLALAAAVPAGLRAWRLRRRSEGRRALAAAAIVFLFTVHCAFDYPLRRPATAGLFVFAIAVLLRTGRGPVETSQARRLRDAVD